MNNILVKEYNDKIAKFMGLTPDSLGFYSAADIRKLGIPFPQYMGNGTTDLQFHTSYDWLMPVLEKIERDLNYFLLAFPFSDDNGKYVMDLFYATFKYDTTDFREEAYVDVVNCETRKEAIFRAIGEFLDKYYSQEEKNRRIAQKQATMRSNIHKHLVTMWSQIGCDNPSNADDIIAHIYDNIYDNGEEVNSETVATGFRRWIEAQQK